MPSPPLPVSQIAAKPNKFLGGLNFWKIAAISSVSVLILLLLLRPVYVMKKPADDFSIPALDFGRCLLIAIVIGVIIGILPILFRHKPKPQPQPQPPVPGQNVRSEGR